MPPDAPVAPQHATAHATLLQPHHAAAHAHGAAAFHTAAVAAMARPGMPVTTVTTTSSTGVFHYQGPVLTSFTLAHTQNHMVVPHLAAPTTSSIVISNGQH